MSEWSRGVRSWRWGVVALSWAACPGVALADGPTKAECAASYERSQELRLGGKLTQALVELAQCSADACPEFVRTDCVTWLGEVQGEVAARKAERRRVAESAAPPAPVPDSSPYAAPEPPAEPESRTAGPGSLRPYAFVAGGVGLAGLAGFAILGASGHGAQRDLEGSCGPTHSCAQADVDSIKTRYLLADVSLGLGIAGLGAGVALFLLSRPDRTTAAPASDDTGITSVDVRPERDGAVAAVSGRF